MSGNRNRRDRFFEKRKKCYQGSSEDVAYPGYCTSLKGE